MKSTSCFIYNIFRYDVNNKLLNAESDIVSHTLKEEKAIQ